MQRLRYGFRNLQGRLNSQADSCGIPKSPTWSVYDLISSYKSPSISPPELKRLHELSALVTPAEGTPEHAELTRELEDLVRLVEAVKSIEVESDEGIPDARIWPKDVGMDIFKEAESDDLKIGGQNLLKQASRKLKGLYVVESSRNQ